MVKSSVFEQKNEKITTKIILNHNFLNSDYDEKILLLDFEKVVQAIMFSSFLVAVLSVLI